MTTLFEAHCVEVLLACQTVTSAQRLLGLSDSEVMSVRQRAVQRGLARRDLGTLRRGGLDEKSFLTGQSFVTVLSDIDGGCVLEVTRDRTQAAAEQALSVLPKEARGGVEAMAMDMHQPFVSAVQATLPSADIVHDRFHIKKHLNEAVNKVRRAEHKERLSSGDKSLTGTRYLFLRNPQDLSESERLSFDELCQMQLRVTRAWGLKEFANNKDVILRRSFQVLATVTRALKSTPAIKKVRAEGHTADKGKADANRDLPTRRAKSVVAYLVQLADGMKRLVSTAGAAHPGEHVFSNAVEP